MDPATAGPSWLSGDVGGNGLVDVHTHAIDPDLPVFDRADPVLPEVRRRGDRLDVLVGGRLYRSLDERAWSIEARIRDMDAEGVAVQVLSPLPGTLCHDTSVENAAALAGAQNEFLARMVGQAPDRFRALGSVPLQDVDLAVTELTRVVVELGFLGVEIGTRVGDAELGDERLRPFFRAAAALGAVVFVHPVDRVLDPRLAGVGLDFGVGMPGETAVAGATILTSGLLEELPELVVVLAHGGGALPQILPRIAHGQKILPTGDQDASSVLTVARQLWCDSLTYDLASLELALQRFELHHVVLGTDYPLAAREQPAGRVLQEWHDLRRDDVAKQIGHANGMRLITDRCATHERSHLRGGNA